MGNKLAIIAIALLAVIIGGAMCSEQIGAGEVGVKFNKFSGVEMDELDEGFHLVAPWVDVTHYSVQEQTYTMTARSEEGDVKGDDSISALTNEGLNLGLDVTVRYALDGNSAAEVHQKLGNAYATKLVRPTIKTAIRGAVSKHTAMEVYGVDREMVRDEMLTEMQKNFAGTGIVVKEVQLRNVRLPEKVEQAIEEKMQADQAAQKMVFEKQKATLEAERAIIEAQGKADAKIIEATGESEALRLINKQLTQKNVDMAYVEQLDDVTTMIVPPGSTPIIGTLK